MDVSASLPIDSAFHVSKSRQSTCVFNSEYDTSRATTRDNEIERFGSQRYFEVRTNNKFVGRNGGFDRSVSRVICSKAGNCAQYRTDCCDGCESKSNRTPDLFKSPVTAFCTSVTLFSGTLAFIGGLIFRGHWRWASLLSPSQISQDETGVVPELKLRDVRRHVFARILPQQVLLESSYFGNSRFGLPP